jgi:hypothetical protein
MLIIPGEIILRGEAIVTGVAKLEYSNSARLLAPSDLLYSRRLYTSDSMPPCYLANN